MRKKIAAWAVIQCVAIAALGQQAFTDSVRRVIDKIPVDTTKVNRLNEWVSKLQYSDPQKALAIANEALLLAKESNYKLGMATSYRLTGVLYADKMNLDSSRLFYDKAYEIAGSNSDKAFQKQAGLILHNYGAIFHKKQQYDSAVAYYIKAIGVFTKSKNDGLAFFPYNNLSSLYSYLKDNNKALAYAKQANAAANLLHDPAKIVSAVNAEVSIRLELKQFDSVFIPLKNNLAEAARLQNFYQEGTTSNLLSNYYGDGRKKYDSAVYFSRKALAAMQKINNEFEVTNIVHNLGYYFKLAGNYDSASKYLTLALAKGKQYEQDYVVQYSLENLVELAEKKGNIAEAHKYLSELVTVKDSIRIKTNEQQLNELEARFQTEKKDIHIQLQQATIQRKKVLNLVLIISVIAIAISGFLLYRNYIQKQRLQQKRIDELEKEKQLMATEAVLKGEEKERTRLAKDLHDGLGGMLSGIKYALNTMKGNLILTPENAMAFERSMDMLDSSIKEMRRVAHNMMPESLVKFGLDTALGDFCNDISQSGALAVHYQSLGMKDVQLNQTMEITIYRIVQELINNSIKHAAASSAIVQISKAENSVAITVEDDGKGFDKTILTTIKGIGWDNIKNRVEFLKGTLDVNSQIGKGTSVHIEFLANGN